MNIVEELDKMKRWYLAYKDAPHIAGRDFFFAVSPELDDAYRERLRTSIDNAGEEPITGKISLYGVPVLRWPGVLNGYQLVTVPKESAITTPAPSPASPDPSATPDCAAPAPEPLR